jgi:hypothetical protein
MGEESGPAGNQMLMQYFDNVKIFLTFERCMKKDDTKILVC